MARTWKAFTLAVATFLFSTTALAQQTTWTVSDAPVLRIGRVEGAAPYLLSRVANALRTNDGLIAIANSGSNEVRLFTMAGDFVRSFGRTGRGPGEFTYLSRVLRGSSDTLVATDPIQYRAVVFTSGGVHVRTETMPIRTTPESVLPDNSYLLVTETGPAGQIGVMDYQATVVRFRPAQARVDTIATIPGGQGFWMQMPNGTMSQFDLPFKLVLSRAFHAERVYIGNGKDYRIQVYTTGPGPQREIRHTRPGRRISPADIERCKQYSMKTARDDNARRAVEQRLTQMPFPDYMPYFSGLLVDSDGNLWVERYRAAHETDLNWDVFDSRGALLASVRGPSGLRVTDIGANIILGIEKDADDVEYVVLYRLSR